jgi:hypothetical protein
MGERLLKEKLWKSARNRKLMPIEKKGNQVFLLFGD